MNEGHRQRFKSCNGLTGEIPTFKVRNWRIGLHWNAGYFHGKVLRNEKHVSLVEGPNPYAKCKGFKKLKPLASPFNF